MKKRYLLFIFLFFFISLSCEKDDDVVSQKIEPTLTKADIIAKELQNYIDASHPTTAAAFIYDNNLNKWVNDNNGTSCNGYKIESPFIQVCGSYYNLEYLVKYEPDYTLKLYFSH